MTAMHPNPMPMKADNNNKTMHATLHSGLYEHAEDVRPYEAEETAMAEP
jgi:hypothetical protein